MKRKLLLLYSLLIFGSNIFAQIPLSKQWDKRFGASFNDELTSLNRTKEGGFILGGYSNSAMGGDKTQNTWGGFDYWIVKLNSSGSIQWEKDFGGTGTDVLTSMQQTIDNGFILGGHSNSGINGDKTQGNWDTICTFGCTYDYWILKTDSAGNKLWNKRYGGTGRDEFCFLQQTSDRGYILGGNSVSGIGGDKSQANWDTLGYTLDYWVVKIDSIGNKVWDKDFGGINFDVFTCLIQTSDDGYLLGGYSRSGISGNKTQINWDTTENTSDYWILKLDSLGNKQWDKVIGGISGDMLYSMQTTADNGFILGGISWSPISGDKTQDTIGSIDYWLVKIDFYGNIQWDKVLGGSFMEDYVGNITVTSDNGYLISGTSYSPASGDKTENNMGPEQTWVVKTDSLGNKQWDKTLLTNNPTDDEVGFAIQTEDSCYIMGNSTGGGIGGNKSQPSQGGFDYWLIKFCDTTSTTSLININALNSFISIYPNPFNSEISFTIQKQNIRQVTFEIKNILGQTVFNKHENNVSNKYTTKIDLSVLPNGIYFIDIVTDGERNIRKVIKQ